MPGWWNGRHAALRVLCSFEREGSSPSSGTNRGERCLDCGSVAKLGDALDLESSAFGLGGSTPLAPTKDVPA